MPADDALGTPAASDGSRATRACRGRFRGGRASPCGRFRRPNRAGNCSGAGRAPCRCPRSASTYCSSSPVPSVATTSACVSPRVNSAEPWVRGRMPTSADDRADRLHVAAVDADAGVEDVPAHDLGFRASLNTRRELCSARRIRLRLRSAEGGRRPSPSPRRRRRSARPCRRSCRRRADRLLAMVERGLLECRN